MLILENHASSSTVPKTTSKALILLRHFGNIHLRIQQDSKASDMTGSSRSFESHTIFRLHRSTTYIDAE